jgi:hypothetical protein
MAFLAQGCRPLQRSKVGSALTYNGRAANIAAKAALGPILPTLALQHSRQLYEVHWLAIKTNVIVTAVCGPTIDSFVRTY